MTDGDYPEPECNFGVAIQRDILQIKNTLEELKQIISQHTDTLQNGLTSKVNNIENKVESIEEQKTEEEEQKEKAEQREANRDYRLKVTIIGIFLSNILALGVGVLVAYFAGFF